MTTYVNSDPTRNLPEFVRSAIRDFASERRALPTRIVCNPTVAPSTWLTISRMMLRVEIVGDFGCPASELRLEAVR